MTFRHPRTAAIALAFGLALPGLAAAQEQVNPPSAANQAANIAEQPVTQALNDTALQGSDIQAAITAEQQAQYDQDRAEYRDSVRARVAAQSQNAAIIERDAVRSARQEDAYARAMIVWRQQTSDCKRGILKECKKPTPMPADYY